MKGWTMLSRQWRISGNLSETWGTFVLRLMWSVVYWFRGVTIGLRGIRRVQLGSRVRHDEQVWFINNWAGQPHMTLSGDGDRKEWVPREEITAIRTPAEYLHRFRVMRRWYMTSWHDIDVNRHVYPDLRRLADKA